MSKKILYTWHKYLGLFSGLLLLVVGLSGTVLVFHQEIDEAEFAPYLKVENTQKVSIDRALKSVKAQFPEYAVRVRQFSEEPTSALWLGLRKPDDRKFVLVHPSNGQILYTVDTYSTISAWMLKLHYALHAGVAGRILVFLTGILFLGSLITGLIVYRKSLVKVFLWKVKPNFKSWRATSSYLHRVVGVWALLFNLMMAITGVWLSYSVVTHGIKTFGKGQASPEPPAMSTSVDGVLADLKQMYPDFHPSYIMWPKSENASIRIFGRRQEDSPLWSRFANIVSVNHLTGKVEKASWIKDEGIGKQLLSMVRPLHYVEYGGWLVKLIYCLGGLTPPLLSITGFLLWKYRRQARKNKQVQQQRKVAVMATGF
ncbi:PepSY-associated TM helix domain-containing protein [Rapidithrix thailandica]|uniref:PepSY-associated TM helix domain-containing protein n=1 Tax=Rapidithrix thailandica TaxID=413964 RepID=A0AAW9S5L0_9BACT